MRESTIFYRSFYEAIKELSKEHQAEVYTAIFEYSLNFYEVELTGIPKTIFTLIKPQLQANIKKYKNGLEPKNKQEVSKGEAKNKQKESKTEGNDNVNDNENEKDKDNEKEKYFDLFWKQYPNKVAKQKCKEKFIKLPISTQEKILRILPDYLKYKPFESYNHPNSQTFLNQKRYDDEIKIAETTATQIVIPQGMVNGIDGYINAQGVWIESVYYDNEGNRVDKAGNKLDNNGNRIS